MARPDGQTCIVMNNCLPVRAAPAQRSLALPAHCLPPASPPACRARLCRLTPARAAPLTRRLQPHVTHWSHLYDLKGTADDKVMVVDGKRIEEARHPPRSHAPRSPALQAHKRFYNISWMLAEAACGAGTAATPLARRQYALGKEEAFTASFPLCPAQQAALLRSLRADAAFLSTALGAAGGLMDYSVILGRLHYARGATAEAGAKAALAAAAEAGSCAVKPLLVLDASDGSLDVLYVGVIDFLQAWTSSKQIAHLIKACCAPAPISTVPPPAYARQFVAHFEHAFTDRGRPWPVEETAPAAEPAVAKPPAAAAGPAAASPAKPAVKPAAMGVEYAPRR